MADNPAGEWIRARFHANEDDWRPVKWPPVGPCWCTGHGEDFSTVVAYVHSEGQISEYWPEASNIIVQRVPEIVFTDRFSKPDWWPLEAPAVSPDNNTRS